MIEFVFYDYKVNMVIFCLMFTALILHIIYVVINKEKYKEIKFYAEIIFCLYILVLTLMPITVAFDKRDGLINVHTYNLFATILGVLSVISYLITMIYYRDFKIVIPIVMVLLTMPYIVNLPYGFFTYLLILISIVLIIRSLFLIKISFEDSNKNSINLLINQGIDTLDSGILFCHENGYVYLCNKQMKDIMVEFFGDVENNGEIFWNKINNIEVDSYDKEFIGEEVYFRSMNKALKFEKNDLFVKNKHYYEVIVSDITKLDEDIEKLKKSQKMLVQQEKNLLNLTNEMIELSIVKEHTRLRTELHDDFGQRLTLFQRIIGSTDHNLYENATELLDNIDEIITANNICFDEYSFVNLINFFAEIGVTIELIGNYPTNDIMKELLFYSVRECTINAVKHSSATEVIVIVDNDLISIKNNGIPPVSDIHERSGLKGLRSRIEEKGASLKIISKPRVEIVICVYKP